LIGHGPSSHDPTPPGCPPGRPGGDFAIHHLARYPVHAHHAVPSRLPSRSQGNSGRHALPCQCGQPDKSSKETPAQTAEGATPMNHPSAPPQQRRAPFTRRTLARLSGLAVLLVAAIGLAPAALATPRPPEPSLAPV